LNKKVVVHSRSSIIDPRSVIVFPLSRYVASSLFIHSLNPKHVQTTPPDNKRIAARVVIGGGSLRLIGIFWRAVENDD
jgi:hypothetical protein